MSIWMPTYDLDDLCQQDSIGDVLAQVLDEARTARLGQVVIGPVCVNLQRQNKHPVSVRDTERRCVYACVCVCVSNTVRLYRLYRQFGESNTRFNIM